MFLLLTFSLIALQCGFRKERPTSDVLTLLNDPWSYSIISAKHLLLPWSSQRLLTIAIWHEDLLSKLPSFGFYPSLCSFISSFLSDHSIFADVDGHFSTKTIDGYSAGLCPINHLFLLFINDLFTAICVIHSYADDNTLHPSTSFKSKLSQQKDTLWRAACSFFNYHCFFQKLLSVDVKGKKKSWIGAEKLSWKLNQKLPLKCSRKHFKTTMNLHWILKKANGFNYRV